jgi:hypothetical protein
MAERPKIEFTTQYNKNIVNLANYTINTSQENYDVFIATSPTQATWSISTITSGYKFVIANKTAFNLIVNKTTNPPTSWVIEVNQCRAFHGIAPIGKYETYLIETSVEESMIADILGFKMNIDYADQILNHNSGESYEIKMTTDDDTNWNYTAGTPNTLTPIANTYVRNSLEPLDNDDLVNKRYVDEKFTDDTFWHRDIVNLTLRSKNFTTDKVQSLPAPTVDEDLTNKKYIDDTLGPISGTVTTLNNNRQLFEANTYHFGTNQINGPTITTAFLTGLTSDSTFIIHGPVSTDISIITVIPVNLLIMGSKDCKQNMITNFLVSGDDLVYIELDDIIVSQCVFSHFSAFATKNSSFNSITDIDHMQTVSIDHSFFSGTLTQNAMFINILFMIVKDSTFSGK